MFHWYCRFAKPARSLEIETLPSLKSIKKDHMRGSFENGRRFGSSRPVAEKASKPLSGPSRTPKVTERGTSATPTANCEQERQAVRVQEPDGERVRFCMAVRASDLKMVGNLFPRLNQHEEPRLRQQASNYVSRPQVFGNREQDTAMPLARVGIQQISMG